MVTTNNTEVADNIKIMTINKLIIDEFYPEIENFKRSPIFKNDSLSQNIQEYFSSHINNIINADKSRTGRFNNTTSTILNSLTNILGLNQNVIEIPSHEIEDYEEGLSDEDIIFLYFTNKISKKLETTLGKTVKKAYLFVTIHCTHVEYGEIIALMKMERVSGVQYSEQRLLDSLDLLPSKEKALEKGSVIFKDKLVEFPINGDYRENTDVFHTKFLDKNDSILPGSFMKKFLDNSIINRDQENSNLAVRNIKHFFTPFLKEAHDEKEITAYLYENITYGSQTSVNSMVTKLVADSGLINNTLLEEKNVDIDSSSADIYSSMLKSNTSSAAEFLMISPTKDRLTIKDTVSNGKFIKMYISKRLITKRNVILDVDIEKLSDEDLNNKIFLGISKEYISSDMFTEEN